MLCPRVYPQLTHTVPRIHKLRQRPVTGVCTAKGSRGRSQSPLVAPAGAKSPCDKKNQVTQEKHTPKSASRKEVMGKNRKFPYRPFYHENPHLKSPKIPPIPCQARHGASKQGCKSAFGTLAAPLIFVVIADIRQTLGMDISTWDYGAQPRLHHAALERKKARA